MKVVAGLPKALTDDAARLYWEVFGGKLGRVMHPPDKAIGFITAAIRHDHAIAAVDGDGRLAGLAGFKTPQGSFIDGQLRDLRRAYGPVSGTVRGLLLSLLERDVDNARFLMDGLCVAADQRGRGVGTALLQALYDTARARGYDAIRLDVIDTNPRARALYEREGFVAMRQDSLGPLRYLFGFSASTMMVRDLRGIR